MITFSYPEQEIVDHITAILRSNTRFDNDTFYFRFPELNDNEYLLTLDKLKGIISEIKNMGLADETALFTDKSYEIIVSQESPMGFRRSIEIKDNESLMDYELSAASDVYCIWLIMTLLPQANSRSFGIGSFFWGSARRNSQDQELVDVLDLIRYLQPRLMTLKITTKNKIPLRHFQSATYSFLFHLGYNLDFAFVPQRYLEEITRRERISRMRRSTIEELDPPRRTYNEDLVNHYILAISTDSPTVQYLSHYHVLEHFFESVFNDDLIEQIKSSITQPNFSYKRKKDVSQLISTIKKSLQIRSETISFSEKSALKLCLKKFVDIQNLISNINKYDPNFITYYSTTEVPFSKGSKINFSSGDLEQIINALCNRIYSTRNALVHSKDGEQDKYRPFNDERALVMEIPLMRFISEMVILSVSEII